jgi:prophage antirepressor-like protein
VVFQEKAIRRIWHNDEWWFSVIDVVGVLSESNNPNRYWSDLKRKLAQEAGSAQPYEKIVRLKLSAPDGKQRVIRWPSSVINRLSHGTSKMYLMTEN